MTDRTRQQLRAYEVADYAAQPNNFDTKTLFFQENSNSLSFPPFLNDKSQP